MNTDQQISTNMNKYKQITNSSIYQQMSTNMNKYKQISTNIHNMNKDPTSNNNY